MGSAIAQASPRLLACRLSPPVPVLVRPNGGQRLPAEVQARMETLFGTSFAEVRVHVSPEVSSLGASAITQGSSIHFAPGCWDPASASGRRLLAHELAHVVQQRTGRARNPFGTGVAVVVDPGLEAEASRMALRAGMAVRQPAVAQRSVAQPPRSPARVPAPAIFPTRGAPAATVLHRPSPLRIVPAPGAPARATAVQPQRTGRILPVPPPGGATVQCTWEDLIAFAKDNQISLAVVGALVALLSLAAAYRYLKGDSAERANLRSRLEGNQFRITAGLKSYKEHFGSDFEKKLNSLKPSDRWLDGGAGAAVAIREYCGSVEKPAQTVAVGYEKPQSTELSQFETQAQNFTYLSGKLFQQFGSEELSGRFELITDYNGVLFYTDTLSEDLQKYLDMLENNGEMYVANFFVKIDGGKKTVLDWLQEAQGIKASTNKDRAFKIVRTGNPVVPQLKLIGSDMSQSPPVRELKSVKVD